ncbi:unnamed protein product [Urochloa humidicola]
MAQEEARLRLALIAVAGNASRDIPVGEARRAIAATADVSEEDLVIKPFHPENFLVECASSSVLDRVLAAAPVPIGATTLSLHPWTRLVHADIDTLLTKVTIELDGIPPHAWDLDTASKILAPHAWIERVDDTTLRKEDISTFKVAAWTRDPYSLPASKKLLIAKPEIQPSYYNPDMQRIFGNLPPYLRQKRMLAYPIDLHLRTIADFRPRPSSTPGPPSPSDNGDSGPDGNPDRSYGFLQGSTGPRLFAFPRRDGRHTGAGLGRGGGRGTCSTRHAGGDPNPAWLRCDGGDPNSVLLRRGGADPGPALARCGGTKTDATQNGKSAVGQEKGESESSLQRAHTIEDTTAGQDGDQPLPAGHISPSCLERCGVLAQDLAASLPTYREAHHFAAPDPMLVELLVQAGAGSVPLRWATSPPRPLTNVVKTTTAAQTDKSDSNSSRCGQSEQAWLSGPIGDKTNMPNVEAINISDDGHEMISFGEADTSTEAVQTEITETVTITESSVQVGSGPAPSPIVESLCHVTDSAQLRHPVQVPCTDWAGRPGSW